jgi:hypothetical protein
MKTFSIFNFQSPICLRVKHPSFRLEIGDWKLEIKK